MKKLFLFCLLSLPFFSIAQSNSSVDIMLSPDVTYRTTFYNGSDLTLQSIKRTYDSLELSQMGFHAGVNYNKKIASKLYLKTGLQVSKFGYKYELKNLVDNSQIDPATGILLTTTVLISTELSHNYYYLNVPIALRYEFSESKFYPYVELGAVPSYLLSGNSKVVSSDGNSNQSPLTIYKQFAVILHFGIGLNYRINEELQAFFQPNIRYEVTKSGSSPSSSPIAEHAYSIGTEFGLRMSL